MSLKYCEQKPEDWKWASLGKIAEINPSPPRLEPDAIISFIPMASISGAGQIIALEEKKFGEVGVGLTGFRDGDVLVAKITPCFENGKGALVKNLHGGVGFGSTEFHVLRTCRNVDREFLFSHTRTLQFRQKGETNMIGSAGQKRVPTDFLRDWTIPLPHLPEQRCIADILGTWERAITAAECARDQSERLYLGLADQSIPFHGPNMRPLGDVLTPDRMVVVDANGPFRALGVRSHGKGTFHRIDDLAALGSEKTLYRIESGRFVVNIVFAWEGAAAITKGEDVGCLVSHRFPTFTINEKKMLPDYLRHMIRMKRFRHLMTLASPGGAGRNKTLNRGDLLAMEVHVPALHEQRKAAKALSVLERQYLTLDRYANLLVKQRDALASELLTGRLRVPDAARPAVAV